MAPMNGTFSNFKRFINQVLPGGHEVYQSAEGKRIVVGTVNVDMDPAAIVWLCAAFTEFANDSLEKLYVRIFERRSDKFYSVFV